MVEGVFSYGKVEIKIVIYTNEILFLLREATIAILKVTNIIGQVW